MFQFYIENGKLKIDNPIRLGSFNCDNIIQDFNMMPDKTRYSLTDEENKKYDQLNQLLDLQIKSTPDNKYCAVYYPNLIYCEFYEQFEPKNNDTPIGRARVKHLFTLRRNSYYAKNPSHDFIVDFVTHPKTNDTMVLFNSFHGKLSIYNMNGQLVHSDNFDDKFVTSLQIINKKYMIAKCWYWGSVVVNLLYDLDKLLTTPDYEPVIIWTENDKLAYDITDKDKVKFYILDDYTSTPDLNLENYNVVNEISFPINEYYMNSENIRKDILLNQ